MKIAVAAFADSEEDLQKKREEEKETESHLMVGLVVETEAWKEKIGIEVAQDEAKTRWEENQKESRKQALSQDREEKPDMDMTAEEDMEKVGGSREQQREEGELHDPVPQEKEEEETRGPSSAA